MEASLCAFDAMLFQRKLARRSTPALGRCVCWHFFSSATDTSTRQVLVHHTFTERGEDADLACARRTTTTIYRMFLPSLLVFPLGTALMIGSTAPIERAPPLNSAYDRSWCALWEQGTNMSGVPHLFASGGGQFISVCLPQ
jgi:hypothetical protein